MINKIASILVALTLVFAGGEAVSHGHQPTKKGVIKFYSKNKPYYELTNFYVNRHSGKVKKMYYKNRMWLTSEHAFQGEKFNKAKTQWIREKIHDAKTAREAFDIAQKYKDKARQDWQKIKDEVMYEVLKSKYSNKHLKNVLNKTGHAYLIEASPYDNYWGWGANHKGKNKLGKTLMRVRKEI